MVRLGEDAATADQPRSAYAERRMQALYNETVAPLFRYLLLMTSGRWQLAEDLLQETYLRVWRKLDQLPAEPGRASAWLFTVARHVAIDAARARQVRPVEEDDPQNLAAVPTTDNVAERVADVQTVRIAMSRLSGPHREILFEVFFQDTAAADVALRLGVPIGTVRSRTFYALRSLSKLINEVGASAPRTGTAEVEPICSGRMA